MSTGVGILGLNMFAYCNNDPTNMLDENGDMPTGVSSGSTHKKSTNKAVVVAVTTVAVIGAAAVTVATFGAGSVAGVATISTVATWAAKATEVSVLQYKKSKSDGKNNKIIAKNIADSLYDNARSVIRITPFTKGIGIGVNHTLNKQVANIFGDTVTWGETLGATGGKVVSYGFATYSWCNTVNSSFSKNPEERAKNRGYKLK